MGNRPIKFDGHVRRDGRWRWVESFGFFDEVCMFPPSFFLLFIVVIVVCGLDSNPQVAQMAQQMMQNPEMMSQMMNSPMFVLFSCSSSSCCFVC